MNELSCKACSVLLASMRQRQMAPQHLLDGLSLTLEWISDEPTCLDRNLYGH